MAPEPIELNARNRRGPNRGSDPDDYRSVPELPPVPKSKQAAVLLSAFLAIGLTIGYNQTYGVFQEYYLSPVQNLLQPAPSSMPNPPTAQLAFVGTLGAGLTWAGAIIVNPLISRIEYVAATPSSAPHASRHSRPTRFLARQLAQFTTRHITIAGVLLMTLGFLLASFARTVPHLLLTQGLLYGIGSSLFYFPILGPAPEHFTTHRATAVGLMLSGGGAGGLILGPMLRALLSKVGGAWTLRILAGVSLLVGGPVALAVPGSRFPAITATNSGHTSETAIAPVRRRTHIPPSLAVSPIFLLATVAAFCQSAGAQLPLAFIPSYSVALGMSASTGASLLAAANALNAVARIGTGYVGDKLGRLNALVVSLFGAFAAVLGLWSASVFASSVEGGAAAAKLWLAFVVLYSVAAGGYYALFPAMIADIFGIRSYAAVNGFIYFVRGCGTMVGSPVGGTLLQIEKHAKGYTDVIYWDAALLLGSTVCVLGVRWTDAAARGWMWRA